MRIKAVILDCYESFWQIWRQAGDVDFGASRVAPVRKQNPIFIENGNIRRPLRDRQNVDWRQPSCFIADDGGASHRGPNGCDRAPTEHPSEPRTPFSGRVPGSTTTAPHVLPFEMSDEGWSQARSKRFARFRPRHSNRPDRSPNLSERRAAIISWGRSRFFYFKVSRLRAGKGMARRRVLYVPAAACGLANAAPKSAPITGTRQM
jgi:hypothetical protein